MKNTKMNRRHLSSGQQRNGGTSTASSSNEGIVPRKNISLACLLKSLLVLAACVAIWSELDIKSNYQSLIVGDNTVKSSDELRVSEPNRPFRMPESGEKWSLFQPEYDMGAELGTSIFAPPEQFINTFSRRIEWLDQTMKSQRPVTERARELYLEMMKSMVSATVFNKAEKSVTPGHANRGIKPFILEKRQGGTDWTYFGDTMTGWKRLDNVWKLLKQVVEDDIPGDYIETGVWRGGSSVFARAVMNVYGQNNRRSYVCDSFAGLPPGDRQLDKGDLNWDSMHWYLAIPEAIVAENFLKYGLLDHNVIFAKGFFNETMPEIKKRAKQFSVMRLDGDMYESTVDVLYNLYDKLHIGGYVIMDDWFGFPSKTACEDFFRVHGIEPEIIPIDDLSAYWKKTEEVDIQFWRYEQSKFK